LTKGSALAVAVLAACSGASGSPSAQPSVDPKALTIAAKDLRFSTTALTAPASKPIQVVFHSQESAPHNVAIYRDPSATGKGLRRRAPRRTAHRDIRRAGTGGGLLLFPVLPAPEQ